LVEGVFGFDPDHHNRSIEWIIVAGCMVATVGFSLLRRRQWLQARIAEA
jgi:hypothetical protein